MIYERAGTPDTGISTKDMKPATTEAKVLSYMEHFDWLVQASNLFKVLLVDFYAEILRIELNETNHWFFINDEINVNICVDEVSISRSPYCTLNAHQAMLLGPSRRDAN